MERNELEFESRFAPTNITNLIRDRESGALISTDETALMEHRRRVENIKKTQAEAADLNTVKADVEELKSSISEIKNLLQALVNKD